MNINNLISKIDRGIELMDPLKYPSDNNIVWSESDKKRIVEGFLLLESTDFFLDQAEKFRSSESYSFLSSSALIPDNNNYFKDANSFLSDFGTLYQKLILYTEEQDKNTISIKLPPVQDFADLAKISTELQTILGQTILHEDIGGKIEIKSGGQGSVVLYILLGGTAAITLLGGIIWAAAVIYKKILEGRIMATQLKDLKIRQESLKEIQEKQAILLGQMIAAEATLLVDENYKENLPEQVERMKNSIKMLADILDRGGEINPSISAPENIKNLFPNTESIMTIASRIKELGDGK